MVGRRRAELHRELHAGAGAELVGVDPQPQPPGRGRLEDGAGLVGVERADLAEGVGPTAPRRAGVEHGPGDERDVLVGPAGVLGRDQVGAEEGHVVRQLGR